MENEFDKKLLDAIRVILGYLNFSSGNHEPRFWMAWNEVFEAVTVRGSETAWRDAIKLLLDQLDNFSRMDEAFHSSDRARFVLLQIRDSILPGYREFHSDLLFHQRDTLIFNSFFLAKTCERLLALESEWDDESDLLSSVLHQLNDYLGYRPIPILEGDEKHEADPHEWVAPVVIWRKGAGAAFGQYRDLVEKTFEIFRMSDDALLQDAWFDPDKLQELVVDPRAYDFDHPTNRRPNYNFGTWDPNFIDKEGYYHRFVVHQVTIDGILQRTTTNEEGLVEINTIPPEELILEAAAVLAGTMLMGSGVSGDHVQTHDSTVTLTTLMPFIASYRDKFYEQLIERVPKPMQTRLKQEEKKYFQPFAGARQSLNRFLAKKRADQLQRFHLARIYARMGYFESGQKQAAIIEVTSARFMCRMDCLIAQAHLLADQGRYIEAVALLPELDDLLHRGIACGALADPWVILGFSGEYSLFPSVDSTIHDHRLDDLISLMNDIFDIQSRLQKEAAAAGNSEIQADVSERMSDLAGWWDQFGSTEVSSVEGFSGEAVWESAAKVSTALAAWYQAGTAAGDVAFWRRHVERFKSPKAFVLLGEALLDQRDLVSTMALLMHWLSQSEFIALTEGDYSFHSIASRWFELLWQQPQDDGTDSTKDDANNAKTKAAVPKRTIVESIAGKWKLMNNFIERLEANADRYWLVPDLELDPACFDQAQSVRPEEKTPKGAPKKSDEKQNPNEVFGSLVSETECRTFRRLYALAMKSISPGLRARLFPELELCTPYLHRNSFECRVICFLYTQLQDVRDSVVEQGDIQIATPFLHPELGALQFTDAFLRVIRALLIDADPTASTTEPLNLERHRMDHYIQLFDTLMDTDSKAFLEMLLATPLPYSTKTEFQAVVEIFERYNAICEAEEWSDYEEDEDGSESPFDSVQSEGIEYAEEDESEEGEDDDTRGIDPLYRAAYDQMTFKDSADDGTEDNTAEGGGSMFHDGDDFDLTRETDRINDRLSFIFSLVRVWKFAAGKSLLLSPEEECELKVRDCVEAWLTQSKTFREDLYQLLDKTSRYHVPKPSGTSDSMMEYDHHRGTKEILMDRIIWSIVEVSDAVLLLEAFLFRPAEGGMMSYCNAHDFAIPFNELPPELLDQQQIVKRCVIVEQENAANRNANLPNWFYCVRDLFSALYRSDLVLFRLLWHPVLRSLENETLLYIPTSRGGDARSIVNCRCLQQVVLRLFECLPRQGLLAETFELLRTVQNMERIRPTLPGAITEFDRLFETATKGIADCISYSTKHWQTKSTTQNKIVDLAEKSVDVLLACWLSHSKHIRISAVESIMNDTSWRSIKSFIMEYGKDLFAQHFLAFRNIRAILHRGVRLYLQTLMQVHLSEGELEFGSLLVNDLIRGKIELNRAANTLELILECIAENYSIYIDYNSTTTQSDHGDKLYMFIDMLRVLTAYERISWNLKPVYWVHETLIRGGLSETASLWEASIARKSAGLSNENLQNYKKLNAEYGIWLPSIHERLQERFVRPLYVNRMLGYVSQAVKDVRKEGTSETFQKLEKLVETFAASPMGVGFEIPDWLGDLEEEVFANQCGGKSDESDRPNDYFNEVPILEQVVLSQKKIERQLAWSDDKIFFGE